MFVVERCTCSAVNERSLRLTRNKMTVSSRSNKQLESYIPQCMDDVIDEISDHTLEFVLLKAFRNFHKLQLGSRSKDLIR